VSPDSSALQVDGQEAKYRAVSASKRPSGTVTALLDSRATSVEDDLRCPRLDDAVHSAHSDSAHSDSESALQRGTLNSSSVVDASNLSTQFSNRFAENFQRGMKPTFFLLSGVLFRAVLNKVSDGNIS